MLGMHAKWNHKFVSHHLIPFTSLNLSLEGHPQASGVCGILPEGHFLPKL